ncbi:MAG: cation:dicarboxylase symporter family transporter [Spirochaetaceae bacterium]|jgi:Na+/H+-dicarboxylate symporter|nr:cation:dicarboxylase symporter family transporter [Spirochaetaceae bacterium]
MKIWIKLLIGSVLGTVLGFLLPYENQSVLSITAWFEQIALHIGRYTAIPMLFFSLLIAVYELRQDREFWPLLGRSFLVMLGGGIFIISMGLIVTLIFRPARIPILLEEQFETVSLHIPDMLLNLFPSNLFNALLNDLYLLPAWLLAFFLAMGLGLDRNYSKPVLSLGDSLSRIFYHIAAFFSEVLALVIIVLASYWAVRYHAALRADIFRDLILLLGIFSLVLGLGIFPLFLYILKPSTNPWAILYGALGSAFAGFFSGDINFTLPVIYRQVKENLGVRRRSNAVTVSLFSIFGRAGSAMVAAVSFIVIIKSYSNLGIALSGVVAIGAWAFLISFLLAGHPGSGAYTALAVLGMSYGRGFEAGYLILKPLAFYLVAVGTFLDVLFCSLASYAVGKWSGFQEDKDMRHFI